MIVDFTYHRPPNRTSSFRGLVLGSEPDRLILGQRVAINHPHFVDGIPILEPGDIAVWFLTRHSHFDVGRVYNHNREFRGYYCDALAALDWRPTNPPLISPVVDLFVDLWIWPDGKFSVLDEDELLEAERNQWVSPAQARDARRTVHELIGETQAGAFPPPLVTEFELPAEQFDQIVNFT